MGETLTEVQQMIINHVKKIQEIRQTADLSKVSKTYNSSFHYVQYNGVIVKIFFFVQKTTKKDKSDRNKVFTDLICSVKSSQAEFLEVMDKQQTAVENKYEQFIKDLQQQITELKRKETELQQLLNTEEHLILLQVFSALQAFCY